jgi:cytochrome c biogenesis protein ResB
VNHPLSFGGLRFYQSSYGALPGGKAHLVYSGQNIESQHMVLVKGDVFKLRERNAVATVLRVEGNMMEMGPAVKLRVVSRKERFNSGFFNRSKRLSRPIRPFVCHAHF